MKFDFYFLFYFNTFERKNIGFNLKLTKDLFFFLEIFNIHLSLIITIINLIIYFISKRYRITLSSLYPCIHKYAICNNIRYKCAVKRIHTLLL